MGKYREVYDGWKNDPMAYWAEAAEGIDWVTKPTTILDDSKAPFYRWYADDKN